MAKAATKPRKTLNDSSLNQIVILRSLSDAAISMAPRHFQINEIADRSGLRDEKEIQRYLYILEGQKLVSPYPEGDFTSKTWYITSEGQRALRTIAQSSAVAM